MAVNGGVAEAHPAGNGLDGQRLQPLFADDGQRSRDDLLLAVGHFLHVVLPVSKRSLTKPL
jgi:hypothetical protein